MDKVGSPRVRPPGSACWWLTAHTEPSENGWRSRAASHAQTGERLGVLGPGTSPEPVPDCSENKVPAPGTEWEELEV